MRCHNSSTASDLATYAHRLCFYACCTWNPRWGHRRIRGELHVTGIIAAIIIGLIIGALGVADTKGIDWIELAIQVALAAVGVMLTAGLYGRR